MDLDRMTRDRLSALSGLEGEPDLALVILDLARSAQAAIPSFLALRVTIQGAGRPITVATRASSSGRGVVRSSLRLEIATAGAGDRHLNVIYLAEQPCAFIEFMALPPPSPGPAGPDVAIRIERLVVDGDVPAGRMAGFATEDPGLIGTDADQSLIERAIGALIGRGFTPEQASRELALWAESSHGTAVEEAQELLLSLSGMAPPADGLEPTSP